MPACKASRVSRYTLCCPVGQDVARTNTASRVALEELVHVLQEAKRQDWTGLNVPVSGGSAKAGAKAGGASSALQAGGAVAGRAQGAGAAAQRAGGQAGDVAQQAGSQAGSQVRQMSQQVLRFHRSSHQICAHSQVTCLAVWLLLFK